MFEFIELNRFGNNNNADYMYQWYLYTNTAGMSKKFFKHKVQ